MNAERWQRIESVFQSALALGGGERAAFLERECAGDKALKREVESLLTAYEKTGSLMSVPADEVAARLLVKDQTPAAVGRTITHYRIISSLGAGGMGEVYLAEDTTLGRKVALKLLPVFFTKDPERLRRFKQEARAASALNHPNILTVHEIGEEAGTHFIATEFIDGVMLRERVNGARMKPGEALDLAVQVADALVAAHAAGVIHRDIKPENVMLRRDGYAKVVDFGLAKLTEHQTTAPDTGAPTRPLVNTEAGVVMGTCAYMSPEQASGKAIDARTDIWSVGAMLYEMVAGRPPFEGETPAEVIARVLEREPVPLARRAPNAPAELQRIVTKALMKDREERYQTIKDLALDLKALKGELEFAAKLERSAAPDVRPGDPAAATGGGGAIGATVGKSTPRTTADADARPTANAGHGGGGVNRRKVSVAIALAVLLLAAGGGYWFFFRRPPNGAVIESIAVLPFNNETGNADTEYLSDGMTESLINSLSQLPRLAVKARSSVFRYKGKEVEPQRVGSELSVQAILNGRIVQRGDDLTVYLSLVDARSGDQLWGERYDRKLTDLVEMQSEITRSVSRTLRARLSGADERKLTKDYTANAEAYQLYLKGRYHTSKLTRAETDKGIAYFQQAINLDPSYALAYVELAKAYVPMVLTPSGVPSWEVMPKAKAAALRAIEIDASIAEAHATLGVISFWYDWDWQAAEKEYLRALEINPNSAEAHSSYANLLSNTGHHARALAEIKLARELAPLDLGVSALEGQMLYSAGKYDEALDRLNKTIELEPNFWLSQVYISRVYMEKGMHAEAVAAAQKAGELSGNLQGSNVYRAYPLTKLGKHAEARAVLDGLLKLSTERYVPPYNIAFAYRALGEREKALAWLEKGYEQRDVRMVFLKVEPTWNDLHGDPRFQELLRKVGFPS